MYSLEEIEQHIKHLKTKIKEEHKLGYNLENSFNVRYLTKSLKSWKDARAHMKELRDETEDD